MLKDASKAAEASPKQWRNYFWIAVGGEVVFIPLIFLLAGFWSPKRAREHEREHEAMVEAELAKLGGGSADRRRRRVGFQAKAQRRRESASSVLLRCRLAVRSAEMPAA